jgi:Peptidase family S41
MGAIIVPVSTSPSSTLRCGPRGVALGVSLLTGLLVLVSCGTAPAHPVRGSGPALALPLNGDYDVTLRTPWFGPVTTRFTAAPTEYGFKANTRPGVAWRMIGGLPGFLGPMFTPFLFPSGMILTWNSTLPTADKPGEGTIGIGQLPSMRVRTRMVGGDRPVEVLIKDGRVVALLTIGPARPAQDGKADYNELALRVASEMKSGIYDPQLATSPQVRGYLRDLAAGAAKATDDLEFLFAAAVSGRANIKFIQPLIYPAPEPGTGSDILGAYPAMARPEKVSFDEKTRIATLHVDAFVTADSVDRAFEEILARNPRGIILDLHTCVGVEIASLRAAAWVIEEPADAGTFFGRAQRSAVLKGDAADIPPVTVCDAASFAALQRTLAERGAARVTVAPEPRGFHGPVAVLTSNRTSSSAEPLVWLLKQSGRAKVYGQTTAGRPLLSREVDVGQGWVLRIASHEFVPPGGERISGRGVKPDFALEKGAAAERAAADILRPMGVASPGSHE